MDKKGNIKEHSQEKLLLYKEYLTNYLSVLTNPKSNEGIVIWDAFAGSGKDDEDKHKGSALIAADLIKEYRNKTKKNILLRVNEKDEERSRKLKINLENYNDFIKYFNVDADQFLSTVVERIKAHPFGFHHLIFLDPHGYTQYSQENLSNLLALKDTEYLIFIPTNHIYRFMNSNDQNNPSFQFLLGLGIDEHILQNIKKIEGVVQVLQKKLKEKAKTEYGYSYEIRNKSVNNSLFHLFFITKHYKGAQKFLEAKNKIINTLKRQVSLFEPATDKIENTLINFLKDGERTNTEIFYKMLEAGFLSKETRAILTNLDKENKIQVENLKGQKIRKFSYYLSDKEKDKDKIKVSLNE